MRISVKIDHLVKITTSNRLNFNTVSSEHLKDMCPRLSTVPSAFL